MAYADIFATEARGMWSPPNGAEPQIIPDRWKNNPEDSLTDLTDKTDDELVALGWKKVDMPSFDTNGSSYFSNNYEWNSSSRTFDSTALTEEDKKERVEYFYFWTKFLNSGAYTTLKTAASTTLSANVLYTEFISLMDDAKRSIADTTKIQTSITEILAGVTFSTDELTELQTIFNDTGMSYVYTLS